MSDIEYCNRIGSSVIKGQECPTSEYITTYPDNEKLIYCRGCLTFLVLSYMPICNHCFIQLPKERQSIIFDLSWRK